MCYNKKNYIPKYTITKNFKKKAFGYIDIIVSIILIGVTSHLIMNSSFLSKTKKDINVNFNMHLLLDSEMEQNRARCKLLETNTCSSIDGIPSSNDFLRIGDSCSFEYKENGIKEETYNITNYCYKENDTIYKTKTTISNSKIQKEVNGYVTNN